MWEKISVRLESLIVIGLDCSITLYIILKGLGYQKLD